MSETKGVKIENNVHFIAQGDGVANVNVNVVNNYHFYNGSASAGDQADRMTKDTSITQPDRMTKDTSITGPSRMTKDTSITQPDRMTKDTSITDRAADGADEGDDSGVEIVNNFFFGGRIDSQSVSLSNNYHFGEEDDLPAGMTKDTSITSRAVQPGQSTGDPDELPDVPNVDHHHIK